MYSRFGSACFAARRWLAPVFLVILGLAVRAAAAAEPAGELARFEGSEPELAPVVRAIDDRANLPSESAQPKSGVERPLDAAAEPGADTRVRELEDEVRRLRAELERYKAALNRAIGELDAEQPDRRGEWIIPREPRAVMSAGEADVSGSVHNANNAPVEGYVVLTVLADGHEMGADRVRLQIPPDAVEEYSTRIGGRFPQGPSYEVKATWETVRE